MSELESLFKTKILQRHLKNFDINTIPDLALKRKELNAWKYSIENSDLEKTKETAIQGSFMERIFGKVLGFPSMVGLEEYNQQQEFKSAVDGSEADSALGFFTAEMKDVRAVIELKDATTNLDKKQNRANHLTPVEQAFSYLYKNGAKCTWVIVSNFKEIRLYHRNSGMTKYQRFVITELNDDDKFSEFYFILCKNNLINKTKKSNTEILYEETEQAEQDITKQFYADYSELRKNLFNSLQENNTTVDPLILFTKAQKIMDRFVFICFCEDKGLLPHNTFIQVIQAATNSFDLSKYRIWNQLKGLFQSIDIGNPPMDINQYNGGLFATDEILDNLKVPDDILVEFKKMSDCDFESDLNVNILGHIFEHSISDIEKIKAEIKGQEYHNEQEKRKADGIYYTPAYVTNYIVDKTIGRWMTDNKAAIKQQLLLNGFTTATAHNKDGSDNKSSYVTLNNWEEIPPLLENATKEQQKHRQAVINLHIQFLEEYSQRLLNLKVLDPACGSGAFLNSAFQFILKEIQDVNQTLTSLRGSEIGLWDIDKQILENNLYGVDINAESVEITKLSLWLQTANKYKQLTSLDHAIKCGNSLIEDNMVDSTNAFVWNEEFREIMMQGGFDIVIGNPPYGATLSQVEKDYLSEHYETTEYNYDTYKTFIELGVKLLKNKGYLGYITPNTYFILERGGAKLRHYLFEQMTLLNIVEMFNVFPDAIVEPAISIYKKGLEPNTCIEVITVPRSATPSSNFVSDGIYNTFKQDDLKRNEDYLFNYHENSITKKLREKIESVSKPLNTWFEVTTGVKPYQKGKGKPPQTKEIVSTKPFTSFKCEDNTWSRYIKGKSVNHYLIKWDGEYIKYGEWLAEPRNPEMFSQPKLFIRRTDDTPMAALDIAGNICNNAAHCIYPKKNSTVSVKFALGMLNSKLIKWIYQHDNFHMVGKPFAEIKVVFVERLPLPDISEKDTIINYAEELSELYQDRNTKVTEFINFITSMYHPKKISEKLETCFKREFSDFVEEMKKQSAKLSVQERIQLLPLFTEYQIKYKTQTMNIEKLEKELNNYIYSIYNLNTDEIKIIEENIHT